MVTSRTDARGAVGAALRELEVIADGAVAIDKGRIVEVGPTRVATPSSTADETERIGPAALALGDRLRLHADQVGDAGGAALAARLGASSADHLDTVSDAGIDALARSGVVGVLLPGVTYHMMEMTPKLDGGQLVPEHGMVINRFGVNLVDAVVKDGRVVWRAEG